MKMLTYEDVVMLHNKSIERYGGSFGIRDTGLIESALAKPYATFGGEDLYKTDIDKIATVVYSLVKNHGFVDGNKRIGTLVMLVLCQMNNITTTIKNNELLELIYGVASGSVDECLIREFIESHIIK